MLLDRSLRHHEIRCDLAGRCRRDERLVRQRRAAQRRQHVELTAGQLGRRRSAQLHLGGEVLALDPADPAACRPESQHIPVVEYPPGNEAPVYPGAVP